MRALTQFLESASTAAAAASDDDWGQFATLETPPQRQYKAKVKSLPRIDEDAAADAPSPSWSAYIARTIANTALERFVDWYLR